MKLQHFLMRCRRACPLALGLAFGLALGLTAPPAAACEVRVRWNDDPPYSMRTPGGQLFGLNVDMVEQTLARLGCKAHWVEMPWARALVELEAGRLDLLPGGLRRPEREPYAYFVAKHSLSHNRLFVRLSDRAKIGAATRLADVLGDLRGPSLKLGVQIGVVYGPEYAELLAQPGFRDGLTQAGSRRSLWQMLVRGRIDGVLASEASARWELAELGWQTRIVSTEVTLSDEPAYVLVSKRARDAEWAQRYQTASEAMQVDGTATRIVRKYFGD